MLKAGATFTPLERERLILNYSVKKVTRTKKEHLEGILTRQERETKYGQRLTNWLKFNTLAFFSSEMIFAGQFQSKDAVTPRGSFITLCSCYSSVLSRLLQKTVDL